MSGNHNAGRASKLTPETQARIVNLMRAGNYFKDACQAGGIAAGTGHKWMAWGDGREYETEPTPKDIEPYRVFREAVIKAEGEAIAEAVAQLKLAGREDWRAAVEYLKRRRPGDWNQGAVQVTHSGEVKISTEVKEALETYAAAFDEDLSVIPGDDDE